MKSSKTLRILTLASAALTFTLGLSAQAQVVTTVATFNGADGYAPFSSVVQGTDGNFYGVTSLGGVYGQGNFYRVTPDGDLTDIYDFCSQTNCTDGATPEAAPILGSDGNFYGVTIGGGSDAAYGSGSGTVYKMTPDGKITILHSFCSSLPCTDGQAPYGIIQASDGNLYGTTDVGGRTGGGVLFQITPAGNFKVMYTFCSRANCTDGGTPYSAPIQGIDGNLYGVAYAGGSTGGGGVLYELTLSGAYKVLYNFCFYSAQICHTGSNPYIITQDANGNLVGTTAYGGRYAVQESAGGGTVFKFTSSDRYLQLASFDNTHSNPVSGVTLANDGNFYGVIIDDSPTANGTIYEVTAHGGASSLYTFTGTANGTGPVGPLFQGTDGNLYGVTAGGGGPGAFGTVFRLSNGLSPLVRTAPLAGKVGQSVLILGNNLTGTTSVTFNGVPAEFTIKSDTYLTATVPSGSTTGTVSVMTPTGTLNSNPQFVVTK